MEMTIKILNLYAGIGGNRKLWEGDIEVTAVEIDPNIAKIYQDFYPNDKVIIGDAHAYLLKHFREFNFIWSSPPCPTHSRLVLCRKNKDDWDFKYPNMMLYEEIIFLTHLFKGKWIIENVISYYDPLIKPQLIGRHYYWSNFNLGKPNYKINDDIANATIKVLEKHHGINLDKYTFEDHYAKRLALRNCVNPEHSLHIFNMAFKIPQKELF